MSRHIVLAAQAAYDSAPGDALFNMPLEILSEGIQAEQGREEIVTVRADGVLDEALLNEEWRGPAEWQASFNTVGWPWYFLLGSVDSADQTPGPGFATHQIPDPASGLQPQPLCAVEINRERQAPTTRGNWRYYNGKVTGVTMQVSSTQSLRGTITMKGGADQRDQEPVTPSWLDYESMTPVATCVKVGPVTPVSVLCMNFNIEATRGVDSPFGLCDTGHAVEALSNEPLRINGAFELFFTDMTVYEAFRADERQVLDVTITGSGSNSLVIGIPRSVLRQATPHIQGRERIMQPCTFGAVLDSASQDWITFTLINTRQAIPDNGNPATTP